MVFNKNINKFALVSVYDKSKLQLICKTLTNFNIGIISTGSTYKKILSLKHKCYEVSKITNFKEILDGRVKTLHPKIYASILFDRFNKAHEYEFYKTKFPIIDFVIVNFYPFQKYLEKKSNNLNLIEMIDIGGPALIRAASKNYQHITTISSPDYYSDFCKNLKLNKGSTDFLFRKKMAKISFKATSKYDENIFKWFSKNQKTQNNLRYGENPHQKSKLILNTNKSYFDYQIQGKKISYNNILDLESGLDFLSEFVEPTVVIIKHNNACGVASSRNINDAFLKAFKCDSKSAYGGVVLLNRKIPNQLAKEINKNFFQMIAAPGFDKKSIETLSGKKNLILLNTKKISKSSREMVRTVRLGTLMQEKDLFKVDKNNFSAVSQNKRISKKEFEDIIFSFKVVKHIKSNAIVLVKNKQTIGIGAGQMNRFDATRIALMKYSDNFKIKDFICASDAFFPFIDCLEILFKKGCSCVVQPSGSVNDKKIVDFVNRNKRKLIFSNKRVFKH